MCHRIRYKHNYTPLHKKNTDDQNRDFSCFTVCHICEKIHYCNFEDHHKAITTTSISEMWDWSSQTSTAQDSNLLACDNLPLGKYVACTVLNDCTGFILRFKQFLKQARGKTAMKLRFHKREETWVTEQLWASAEHCCFIFCNVPLHFIVTTFLTCGGLDISPLQWPGYG